MESLINQTIDNYHILEILGQGGMGVVYKAEDKALEKIVAIKVIDPFLARDESFLRRFKTEAKAMAKLTNPNIVSVYALRETKIGFFMVMEYVNSKTLSEWIKERGSFSLEDTIFIAKQLLGAIGSAHNAGVIHRDIKPSNILVSEEKKVKIMDFGLAKVMRTHSLESTVTNMRAGTLYYMSPEQVKGLKNVDIRSDLYSLGMTIYEMLAGRSPFDKTATQFTIQKQIVDGKIPSPIKFNSDISKPFAKFIQKVIAQDPSKRFQKAEDMLKALEELELNLKQKTAIKETTKSSSKKNYKPFFYGAIGFFLLILLALYFYFDIFNTNNSIKPAYLTINTIPPNATISVNKKIIGQSPITKLKTKLGNAKIKIRKNGFQFIDTNVVVENSEKYLFTFNLKKKLSEINVKEEQNEKDKLVEFGTLEINSTPSGSIVYLNGKRVGKTPFNNNKLKTDQYSIVVRNKDYVDYKRTIIVTKNKSVPINAKLIPAGIVDIESDPTKSIIYLDGKKIGATPYKNKKFRDGKYKIKFIKSGYKDFDTILNVQHKKTTKLIAHLELPRGVLKILVRPYGSVFIDNKLKSKNSIAQLSDSLIVGSHTIKAVHPTLGHWEKQIKISDNKMNEIVVDFNKDYEVIVTSSPINAQIIIDGKLSGKYTPKLIKIRTGNHSISVQKKGYNLVVKEKTLLIESNIKDEPIHFNLIKN